MNKQDKHVQQDPLVAKKYYSGFVHAHDTYHALSTASDGKVYYILSSDRHDIPGQMFMYDPVKDETEFLANLNTICGEEKLQAVVQGKSHVPFFEYADHFYFATHVGFYEIIEDMERLPVKPPNGYKLYPGGHFLSYNLKTRAFHKLATAPDGEGIITMAMDTIRGNLFGITWPKGYFIHYDLTLNVLTNLGPISSNGEAGIPGSDYRVLCRSMFVDDRDGIVYFSTANGDIFSYDPKVGKIILLPDINLRLDYFGNYDHTRPGSMAYNWRKIIWHPDQKVAYGVHGNSGYLFRFDPQKKHIEIIDRLTSTPSKKSGMFDYYTYGYLGFDLSADQETIYYLTGGPMYEDGVRSKATDLARGGVRGVENLHLITYHLPTNKYLDHGPVFYEDGARPTYVNSIAIGPEDNIYALARFEHDGQTIADLIKISNPL